MLPSVYVYTGNSQHEQPMRINNVTALSMVDRLLLIECEKEESGYKFSAFHRFDPEKWTHYEVS